MKLLVGLAVAAAVFLVLYFAVGLAFYRMAIDAHSEKWFLKPPTKKKQKRIEGSDSYAEMRNDVAETEARALDSLYFEQHPPQIWHIVSSDRHALRLGGYYFPPKEQSDKWLVFFHGYASSIDWSRRWIRTMSERGYHVLAPDMRGHGISEGDYIGMGWDERMDVLDWVNAIVDRDPGARILISGVSMGGATVLCAAGESLPPQVKGLISDCGYTSVRDILSFQLHALFKLPDFPFLYAARTAICMRAGYDIFRASALEQLKKAERPMLFIHGEKDTFVPFYMLQQIYDAAACEEKEMLAVPGAGHGTSCCTAPELYWRTYLAFADRYLP